ncbi:MAG: hypothetical protein V7731_16210 [Amphritea sp.]
MKWIKRPFSRLVRKGRINTAFAYKATPSFFAALAIAAIGLSAKLSAAGEFYVWLVIISSALSFVLITFRVYVGHSRFTDKHDEHIYQRAIRRAQK